MIIRRKHNSNYTVIGNDALNDDRLSFAALGLLCYLRGRPNDWTVQLEQLRKREGCGRERMQGLMRELIEAGWVVRQRGRNSERGTFGAMEYIVLDEPLDAVAQMAKRATLAAEPQSENPTVAPESEKPEPGPTGVGSTGVGKPDSLLSTDSTNSEPKGSAPPSGPGPSDFREDLFGRGVTAVRALTGRPEERCRRLVGQWLKVVHDDARIVLTTIDEAVEAEASDPVGWIEARLRRRPGVAVGRTGTPVAPDLAADRQAQAQRMVERGEWPIGGSVFVAADSPEGAAWERHFTTFGMRPRWRDCGRNGFGWNMPSAMPAVVEAGASA